MTRDLTWSGAATTGADGLAADAMAYARDAAERAVLFADVMRQRGNQYRAHIAEAAPHVLEYDVELVVDGRTLPRPVNYLLVRVRPPAGIVVDPMKRPFVIVDPRAGHGPGIGGFKADSEIGVAFAAGHPCYFVGFLPDPVPGQTIEDIAVAEATFLERVIALHPDADGKPCVVGNCQAGWAVTMLAAIRPELFGPIIIAGSPLAYWAGVHGKYPMRYAGGLLGGSWLTALASDLGGGTFDGAWLVQNFENQNPANTLWTKQYNLYSNIDTEAPRYLGFEKWWGGHVNLNAEEIQFIVDELFIGNKLTAGEITTSSGTAVDLRTIRSPIVVFCSKGDNITPPQQALHWILDLYDSVDEIRAAGQTIVYLIHESVGHLGIFVSGGVAKKEHGEFANNIDLIDALPPGLYEAVLTQRAGAEHADLASGDWIARFEMRDLDDLRALGGNDAADERRFEAAARVSEINLALYRTFVQPFVKTFVAPTSAMMLPALHPLRLQYTLFSDANPFMAPVRAAAGEIRKWREPLSAANPFLAWQETVSAQVVSALDAWRTGVESLSEDVFELVYGSPVLQAAVGVTRDDGRPTRRAAKSPLQAELLRMRIDDLRSRMTAGGLREGVIRALLFAALPRRGVDERGFEALRRLREDRTDMTLAEFKATVRDQFLMLLIDEEAAIAALPALLPEGTGVRRAIVDGIRSILSISGAIEGETAARISRLEAMLLAGADAAMPDATLPAAAGSGTGHDGEAGAAEPSAATPAAPPSDTAAPAGAATGEPAVAPVLKPARRKGRVDQNGSPEEGSAERPGTMPVEGLA
jgi:hypothetical protein